MSKKEGKLKGVRRIMRKATSQILIERQEGRVGGTHRGCMASVAEAE